MTLRRLGHLARSGARVSEIHFSGLESRMLWGYRLIDSRDVHVEMSMLTVRREKTR